MPDFYLFGGPNGAGKTTSALKILPALGCRHFVNADLLASGLSPLDVEAAALKAGILMMRRLRELAQTGEDFATESTLAARAYAPLINRWRAAGYRFNLFYLWLPDAEMAVARVAARVKAGGHDIPVETIRRRYQAGRRNFLELYQPLADAWIVLDNSGEPGQVAARGGLGLKTEILRPDVWQQIHGEES